VDGRWNISVKKWVKTPQNHSKTFKKRGIFAKNAKNAKNAIFRLTN
jgi:hypothetical protein